MNDNEKLIEEAFKKHEAPAWDEDAVGRDAAIRWHMRGFNDAIAVFEKAHTPTNAEREALVDAAMSVDPEPFKTWRYRMTVALRAAVTDQGSS